RTQLRQLQVDAKLVAQLLLFQGSLGLPGRLVEQDGGEVGSLRVGQETRPFPAANGSRVPLFLAAPHPEGSGPSKTIVLSVVADGRTRVVGLQNQVSFG